MNRSLNRKFNDAPYAMAAIRCLTAWLLVCLAVTTGLAQEEPAPLCKATPGIKSLVNPKTVLNDFFVRDYEGQESFCTSMLKSGGAQPANKADDMAQRNWSCKYGTPKLFDGNPATAWAEGVKGNGAGEMVLITGAVDPSRKVEIWAGLGSSEALFKANSRPKNIRVHIIKGAPTGAAQTGYNHENVSWVASTDVTLNDLNGYQPLPLPGFKKEIFKRDPNEWEYSYWILIELVDFYPGSKYEDTCIAEVRNAPN